MKQRNALHLILSFAVAVMLIICGTAFETRYSSDPAVWLKAHSRTPLLWLIDFTAVYTLILMTTIARARRRIYSQAEELYILRAEHNNQLGATLAHTNELEALHEQQAERIEALEREALTQQNSFETEARHLVEQMFHSLQNQVEAHGRQLDAVNMALQYQRAELSELRHQVRGNLPASSLSPNTHLTSAEVAALNASLPALAAPPAANGTLRAFPTGVTGVDLDSVVVVETNNSAEPGTENTAVALRHSAENEAAVFDPTVNAESTYVLNTAEFDALHTPSVPAPLQENTSGN